jgi:hypothetical protein
MSLRPPSPFASLAALVLITLVACKKDGGPSHEAPGASSAVSPPAPSSSSSSAPTLAVPMTFVGARPVVGRKQREAAALAMTIRIHVDPGNGHPTSSDVTTHESTTVTQEVLAVDADAGASTKVKVTFDTVERSTTEGGVREPQPPSPVAGKTYVVLAKNGAIEVTTSSGSRAPKVESDEVAQHFRALGRPDPMIAALPTEPVSPGAPVGSLAKALADYVAAGADGTLKVGEVTVAFKGRSGDDGVFAVTVLLTKEEGAMAATIHLAGELRVSAATGEPTALSIEGPIAIGARTDAGADADAGGASAKTKIDGAGTMSITMNVTSL